MESDPKPWPLPNAFANRKVETVPLKTTGKMQRDSSASNDDKAADIAQNPSNNGRQNTEMGNRKDGKYNDDSSEPTSMYSSARPVVLPIVQKFAQIDEGAAMKTVSSSLQPTAPNNKTDDTLQCPLCLSSYSISGLKTPKLLPCLHTFCSECVKGVLSRRQCATCKKTFVSAEDLSNNFLALEHVDSKAVKEGQARMCEECEDGDSSHRCLNCCRFLCTLCKSQHMRAKATKAHSLQTMEELRASSREIGTRTAELCTIPGHGEQRITMYCFTCSKLVCMQCVVLDHPAPVHAYSMIEQAFISEASTLHSMIGDVEKQDAVLDSVEKEIQNAITELRNSTDTAVSSITSLFDTLKSVLSSRKDQLLQEIDEIYRKKADVLNSQVESMKAASEQMRGAQTFVDHALKSGPKALVLKLKGPINDALSEAKTASRSLLLVKENPILSFDAGGSHEIEASIKTLGRVDIGRRPPMILASMNGVRPVSWAGGNPMQNAPYHHPQRAQEREAEHIAWPVRTVGEMQPRYSLPAGALTSVQYPDPPLSMSGIQSGPNIQLYGGGAVRQASSGAYGAHINIAMPSQQPFRLAGSDVQPHTAMWGNAGVHIPTSKYSTLD